MKYAIDETELARLWGVVSAADSEVEGRSGDVKAC